jgi:hypothetical protein
MEVGRTGRQDAKQSCRKPRGSVALVIAPSLPPPTTSASLLDDISSFSPRRFIANLLTARPAAFVEETSQTPLDRVLVIGKCSARS